MPNEHMKVACQFRLGLPLRVLADAGLVGEQCPRLQCSVQGADGVRTYVDRPFASCQAVCDPFGDHVLACKTGTHGRIHRHNSLVYSVRRLLAAQGGHCITSQTLLAEHMLREGVGRVPPGVHLQRGMPDGLARFPGEADVVWDNAITAFATREGAAGLDSSTEPGAAVRNIEQDKFYKYESALRARPPISTRATVNH